MDASARALLACADIPAVLREARRRAGPRAGAQAGGVAGGAHVKACCSSISTADGVGHVELRLETVRAASKARVRSVVPANAPAVDAAERLRKRLPPAASPSEEEPVKRPRRQLTHTAPTHEAAEIPHPSTLLGGSSKHIGGSSKQLGASQREPLREPLYVDEGASAPPYSRANYSRATHSRATHSRATHSRATYSRATHSRATHSRATYALAHVPVRPNGPHGWGHLAPLEHLAPLPPPKPAHLPPKPRRPYPLVTTTAHTLPPARLAGTDGPVYEAELLLAEQAVESGRRFLVRWAGFGPEHDTWEEESHILDTALVRAFDAARRHGRGVKRPRTRVSRQTADEYGASIRVEHLKAADGRAGSIHVGEQYQVSELPRMTTLAPTSEPTMCRCHRPVIWERGRWWCAAVGTAEDCGFEMHPPPCTPPLCDCRQPAAWLRRYFFCEAQHCAFELKPQIRSPPTRVPPTDLERDAAVATAALLTAAAYGPVNAWGFVAPCDVGLGLFARVPLVPGQCIGEYGGPRLPSKMARVGEFVLEVAGTRTVIDVRAPDGTHRTHRTTRAPSGQPRSTHSARVIERETPTRPHSVRPCGRARAPPAPSAARSRWRRAAQGACENSPLDCPRYPAIFANHSAAAPNARLETWPVLQPGKYALREHIMLVATAHIEAGAEVRFDYEAGGSTYWASACPEERLSWREARVSPPPPTPEEPVVDRMSELRAAAALRQAPPPCREPIEERPVVPWEGAAGGDVRLQAIVPLLQRDAARHSQRYLWAMASTHLPGRTGQECYTRWLELDAGL